MALSAQAALLDELMGKNRNAAPGDRVKNCHFTDGEVCKHFLCGFCPHELFVNTRADLGPCDKIHDENLRKQYDQSSRKGKMGYEDAFEVLLRSLLSDVEKRIKKGRDRLSLTQGSDDKLSSVRHERIHALNQQIDLLIAEADLLGREGSVELAKETLDRCERLKVERLDLETRCINENAKAMEVCNVCGSFLIVGDAQCRVEEHITGKQHVGFARIRATVEQMKAERERIADERRKAREESMKTHDDDRKGTRSDRNIDNMNPSSTSPPQNRNASRYHSGANQRFHRSGDSFNHQHGYSSRHGRYHQGRRHADMDNSGKHSSPGSSPSHDRNGQNWRSHNREDQRSSRYRSGDWGGRDAYSNNRDRHHRREDAVGQQTHSNLPDAFDSWDELVANVGVSDDAEKIRQDGPGKEGRSRDSPSDADMGACSQATRNALLNLAGCADQKVVLGQNAKYDETKAETRSGSEEFRKPTKQRHEDHDGERTSRKLDVNNDSGYNQGEKRAKKRRMRKRASHSSQSKDTSSNDDQSQEWNGKSGRHSHGASRKNVVAIDGDSSKICKNDSSSNDESGRPSKRVALRGSPRSIRHNQKRMHKSTSSSSSSPSPRSSSKRHLSSSTERHRGHRTRHGRRHHRHERSDSSKGENLKRTKKISPRRPHRRTRSSSSSTSTSSS